MSRTLALLACVCRGGTASNPLVIDPSAGGQTFHGLGAISGGGATSRLLVDYPEPQKSEILDYLFKPNYGASLHMFKVEIGGDSQSTDGTETSHMHTADSVDYNSGYEWWLLKEAKKRNPEIKTYGLPWAYPGWVGGPEQSGSPFKHPELTSKYILKWLEGARDVYGIDIDYIGIWNERSSDATYAKELRKTLNAAGFNNTVLVAKDGDASICNEMAGDKGYQDAIGVVGLHYPSDFNNYSNCKNLGYGVKGGKPLWASEESSSYDDLNGAACWATVVTRHWVLQGMTSSIMWNLIGSYFHGTQWYASSMMTAVEPWSGNYNTMEVVWATAHITQFTKVGWTLLDVGSGSGILPKGGYYATYCDPESKDWTLTVVKINHDHAPCTRPSIPDFNVSSESVTFRLSSSMRNDVELSVWYSNFQDVNDDGSAKHLFERLANIKPNNGVITLDVPEGSFYTISTILNGPQKGKPASPVPESQPSVPLPYSDDFESYAESQEGKWWSDQIGAFEVHKSSSADHGQIMRMMTPELPIGWSDHGSNGPFTLLGMREWQDITVRADIKIPSSVEGAQGCVATRADQMWIDGVVLCVTNNGTYSLTVGGPKIGGSPSGKVYKTGTAAVLPMGFSTVSLTTISDKASAKLNGVTLFEGAQIRDVDTGFVGIGASHWMPIEYDNIDIEQAGSSWAPSSLPSCNARVGTPVRATNCSRNGFEFSGEAFDLLADWGIRHRATGLCVTVSSLSSGATLTLQKCDHTDSKQAFKNDYTAIRNWPVTMLVGGEGSSLKLVGSLDGSVEVGSKGSWTQWLYFPNSKQLRNQYTASKPPQAATKLGYPMCLTACDSDDEMIQLLV